MDLTGLIAAAINAWLSDLGSALLVPALSAVSALLFRTPALSTVPAVAATWALLRGVADALFVLAWCAAGVLVMTQGGTDSRYAAKVLVPRVALAAVLVNVSLVLCGAAIALNNAVVDAVLAPSPVAVVGAAFSSLTQTAHPTTDLLAVVLSVAAAVLALVLVAVFVGRAFLLLLAVALAPLALATYALPQTDDLARLWWRIFAGLLFVQVLEAVLVRVAAGVIASGDWLGGPAPAVVSGLVVVTLLYALVRLPFAAYSWAFHARLERSVVVRTLTFGARAMRRGI